MIYAAESYFLAHELVKRHCSGKGKNRHMCFTKTPSPRYRIELSLEAHAKYKGSVIAYVKDVFRIRKEPLNIAKCWRKDCNHPDNDIRLYSALVFHPICLRIDLPRPYRKVHVAEPEVPTPSDAAPSGIETLHPEIVDHSRMVPVPFDAEPLWDFPDVITLPGILDAEGRKAKYHYNVIGRAVHSEEHSHFYAYMTDPANRCYLYDDLKNKGALTKTASSKHVTNTMAGHHWPSKGERTVAVVYHLREGEIGQDQLLRWTHSEILDVHRMTIPSTTLSTDTPVVTFVDGSWRELKTCGEGSGEVVCVVSDIMEYECEGQSKYLFPKSLI